MINQEEFKKIVSYDKNTGIFTWLSDVNNKTKKGMVVGCVDGLGYIEMRVCGIRARAHRFAFLWMLGYMPENQVDHIDQNKKNNEWNNLREVTKQCNMRNQGNISSNKSGVKGVYYSKQREKWVAQIKINRKTFSIGGFEDFAEAVAHRLAAEQCIGWSWCEEKSPAMEYIRKAQK